MATLLSYAGTCCIGVNMDAAAVTKPDLLMSGLQEGLDEVLALGDVTRGPTDRTLGSTRDREEDLA
jgi:hypothetical protein